MKYIDVFPVKGGINGLEVAAEIIKELIPDVIAALAKRKLRVHNEVIITWLQQLLALLSPAGIACYKKHQKPAPKIRLILKITEENKAFIFFVPYSLDNEELVTESECPVALLGGDAKDYEDLCKKYPNVKIALSGGNFIGNN